MAGVLPSLLSSQSEGGRLRCSPGHTAWSLCPGPSQLLRSHRDPSPGLSLPLWASITCIGLTRTFQNQWRGGAPTWPLEQPDFLGEANPHLSPLPLYRRGSRGCGLSGNTSSLPAWPQPPPVGAGGPPCTLQGVRSGPRWVWPSGWGGGGDAWASPAARVCLAAAASPAASPRAGGSQRPSSCPQTQRRPWLGRSPSQPLGAMSPWRRARELGPV